jgi:hypothetical protein
MIEKATWKDGELRTTLFEPFEILRHSNRENLRKEKTTSGPDSEIWLPERDITRDGNWWHL